MDFPRPPPVRGLIRRPEDRSPVPRPPSSPDPPRSPSPSSLQLRSSDGVVVVGFISRRPDDSSQLINRVLDSNVFGSGNLDKILSVDKDEVRDWFSFRRISYYHDEEKGILFVQFCPTRCPAWDGESDPGSGFDSFLEEQEFGDLRGLLFMFSVCHVIIYIQEGSRFDTQLLKKFRVLQAAKQALAPYIRSRTTPPLPLRPHSSSPSRSSVLANSSAPARGGGIISRNASSMSLMSGLGSYTSLFPGQCNPVMLFVFLDDFLDMQNLSSSVEESASASSLNQSLNSGNFAGPTLPIKGPGSIVVLSRPGSKSEGGLRKKLQQSLEAQIRFLIKKCRTLSGSESCHVGSRSGPISSSAPLFSLDASKTVVLLDRSTNKKGEALEFATSLVDDILNGKAKSESLLLEKNAPTSNKEDVLSVKEFIYRCSDILRGKGGLAGNSSNAGVGMVAVAAAAAAASAASGKTFSAPQLPHLDEWLSCSHQILNGVLTAKCMCTDEIDIGKKKLRERNVSPAKNEEVSSKGADALDIAVSWLGSGKGLNSKFSNLWCERALPAAKDVYFKDLPACYPTLVHEAQLQKALHAFNAMVRGPSLQSFTKRLEDECVSIWKSGRQSCDATSLTGKPCMHQRHNIGANELLPGAEVKPHSSGYVFLHACACGRSRRLRSDPFDFESANVSFNCFLDCDKHLPSVKLPEVSSSGPMLSSSWSLVRVGGSRYYEPSKGLLQSGFSATQKFLLKWVIFLGEQGNPNGLLVGDVQKDSKSRPDVVMSGTPANRSKVDTAQVTSGVVNHGKSLDNCSVADNKISFGRGLPNFTMKKPFSEVVAGSASTDLLFPPLQQRRQPAQDKVVKQKRPNGQSEEQAQDSLNQESQESEHVSCGQEISDRTAGVCAAGGDPFLQIGSNVVPVNMKGGEKVMSNLMPKHVTVYIGFEHECPHGHRFLLSTEHLSKLGPLYSVPEESRVSCAAEPSNLNLDTPKVEKNPGYGKGRRKSNRMASAMNRMKNMDKSRQIVSKDNPYMNGFLPSKEHNWMSANAETVDQVTQDLGTCAHSNNLGDSGLAFSMLNRNLPIYMNCPHCLGATRKKDSSNIEHAHTISQLQRIFLVTPSFPLVLATCPIVKFQESCLPPSVEDREKKLQFSLGCPVILPPDSFLTLRLPFVYGVKLDDGTDLPLEPSDIEPEETAWIVKGTALQHDDSLIASMRLLLDLKAEDENEQIEQYRPLQPSSELSAVPENIKWSDSDHALSKSPMDPLRICSSCVGCIGLEFAE